MTTALLATLQARFTRHPRRHPGIAWAEVQARLQAHPAALASLAATEASGGEPGVTGTDEADSGVVVTDCAADSPVGRRSLCFDRAALDGRGCRVRLVV